MKLGTQNIGDLLNNHTGKLKVSIYIPTDPQKSTQDKTRLKNALQIVRNDVSYDDRELGEPMRKIYDELMDNEDFWNHQDFGLAVFFNRDGYEYFHIPFEITEAEYVLDHFVISPLITVASADTGFYLLDINLTSPRLFSGARGTLTEMEVPNMPKGIESTITREVQKDYSLIGDDGPITEDQKRYFKIISDAVDEAIDYDTRALLLAGTTNRTGNIRTILKHGHVLPETLVGSYEKAPLDKLYQDSYTAVRAALRKELDDSIAVLDNTPPELVAIGSQAIKKAADAGRVATLFVPTYRLTNDSVRETTNEKLIIELPADIESIEGVVTSVLKQSGKIVSVEIGRYDSVQKPTAICRY